MPATFSQPHLYPVPRFKEGVERTHPAYTALFEAYAQHSRSPIAALRAVDEWWDADLVDGELPTVKTVRRWSLEDQWDAVLDEWAGRNYEQIMGVVNNILVSGAPNAARQMMKAINGEIPDPKEANVIGNLANKWLLMTAAGIAGTRYGQIPVNDQAKKAAVKAIASMSVEDVLELRRQAIAAEESGSLEDDDEP